MSRLGNAAWTAVLLTGAAFFSAAPAFADDGVGLSFGYDGGGFSDPCAYYDYYDEPPPWGLPPDYCDYPVYFEPVYYGGRWFRGPIYYRWYGGERLFWINGGWRRHEWRGPMPYVRWQDRGGWHRDRHWSGGWDRDRGGRDRGRWNDRRDGNDRGGWDRGRDRGWSGGNRGSWSGGHDWNGGWSGGNHTWNGHGDSGGGGHGNWPGGSGGGHGSWSGGGGGGHGGSGGHGDGHGGWSGGGNGGGGGHGGGNDHGGGHHH